MKRCYIVMCKYHIDTNHVQDLPLTGTKHTKRFDAFLEMQHAKDNPQYAGEIFYIKEVME